MGVSFFGPPGLFWDLGPTPSANSANVVNVVKVSKRGTLNHKTNQLCKCSETSGQKKGI